MSFYVSAQTSEPIQTTAKQVNGLVIEKLQLSKRDQTSFSSTEKESIINYINALSPRVLDYKFTDVKLFVSLEPDLNIFDLMEGIKEKGISLVYYEDKEMHFVNDDLKIETWNVK